MAPTFCSVLPLSQLSFGVSFVTIATLSNACNLNQQGSHCVQDDVAPVEGDDGADDGGVSRHDGILTIAFL